MRKPKWDWKLALGLYLAGQSLRDVALKLGCPEGTVAAQCTRKGWTALRDAQNTYAKQLLASQPQAITLEERAQAFRLLCIMSAEQSMQALLALPIATNIKEMRLREEVMTSIVKRGRTAFGLDNEDSAGRPVINIAIQAGLTPVVEQLSAPMPAKLVQEATIVGNCEESDTNVVESPLAPTNQPAIEAELRAVNP